MCLPFVFKRLLGDLLNFLDFSNCFLCHRPYCPSYSSSQLSDVSHWCLEDLIFYKSSQEKVSLGSNQVIYQVNGMGHTFLSKNSKITHQEGGEIWLLV